MAPNWGDGASFIQDCSADPVRQLGALWDRAGRLWWSFRYRYGGGWGGWIAYKQALEWDPGLPLE